MDNTEFKLDDAAKAFCDFMDSIFTGETQKDKPKMEFNSKILDDLKDPEFIKSVMMEKPDRKGIFHLKAFDIPDGLLRGGIMNMEADGNWVYFLCKMTEDGEVDEVLLSLVIHDPKRLRSLAKNMEQAAEKIEKG